MPLSILSKSYDGTSSHIHVCPRFHQPKGTSDFLFYCPINPSPNDKFLHSFKLKAAADDNFNIFHRVQFFFDRVKNIVGKGENAVYQHFLLFAQCF